ncbi:MAG: rhomboid family intramembrane serine protease [Spongiibacteraceae bacterium]
MTEIVVVDVAADQDLSEFSQYLWSQGVSHRVLESQERKLLLTANKQVAIQVRQAYEKFLLGDQELPLIEVPTSPAPSLVASRLFIHLPITLSFILLSILGYLLVNFDHDFSWVRYLTFYDFNMVGNSLTFKWHAGQYWRLITPIFLHFGLMHIAFNMTLLWFLGQRIELLQGSIKMLGICLLIGLGSNIMQAVYTDAGIFGGMSGVVYGLLGYGWVWNMVRPERHLHIPSALVYFSLFMLVLGFSGFVSLLGAGEVANLAHLGGLIMGCLIGLGAALIDRRTSADHSSE